MDERRLFKVAVVETLRTVVAVPAFDEAEAHRRVSDAWQAGEVTLGGRDFDGAEIHVLGEATEAEAEGLGCVDKDASGIVPMPDPGKP